MKNYHFLSLQDLDSSFKVESPGGNTLIANKDPHACVLLYEPSLEELKELTRDIQLAWCEMQWHYLTELPKIRKGQITIKLVQENLQLPITCQRESIGEMLTREEHQKLIHALEQIPLLERGNYFRPRRSKGFNWCISSYEMLMDSNWQTWIGRVVGWLTLNENLPLGRWRSALLAEVIKRRWVLLPAEVFATQKWLKQAFFSDALACRWSDTSSRQDNQLATRLYSITNINHLDEISQPMLDRLAPIWLSIMDSQSCFKSYRNCLSRYTALSLEKPKSLAKREQLSRIDAEFRWVYNEEQSKIKANDTLGKRELEFFAKQATQFIESQTSKSVTRKIIALNDWFTFLLSLPVEKIAVFASPVGLKLLTRSDYIRSFSDESNHFMGWLKAKYPATESALPQNPLAIKRLGSLRPFFSWLAERMSLAHLETLILDSDLLRPTTQLARRTHREAIPPKMLNLMRDIVTGEGNWKSQMLIANEYVIDAQADEDGWYWGDKINADSRGIVAVRGDECWSWSRLIESDWFKLAPNQKPRSQDAVRIRRTQWSSGKIVDTVEVWSPCRATMMSLFLYPIPVRFDTMQSADDGLNDLNIYSTDQQRWHPNPHLSEALQQEGRQLGVFRRYTDLSSLGEGITGLYFTNAKTGNPGQEVPFQLPQAINENIENLRRFNEYYGGPAPRIHRRDIMTSHDMTAAAAARLPDFYPLFRDLAMPTQTRKVIGYVMSKKRFESFYLLLLDALERAYQKLVDQGEADPINPIITQRYGWDNQGYSQFLLKKQSAIREAIEFKKEEIPAGWTLTDKYDKGGNRIWSPTAEKERELRIEFERGGQCGNPIKARWDIHTLRVSGITALATAGLPIPILAEFLAGHASILMDLYYVKVDKTAVQQMVEQCIHRIHYDPDINSLACFHHNEELAKHALAAHVHQDALLQLANTNSGDWLIRDGFLCPCSGSLCHIGSLEPVEQRKFEGKYVHGMVEGGEGNCALCRFAVAGPFSLQQQYEALMCDLSDLTELKTNLGLLMEKIQGAMKSKNTDLVHSLRKQQEALEKTQFTRWKTVLTKMEYLQQSTAAADRAQLIKLRLEQGDTAETILEELTQKSSQLSIVTANDSESIRLIAQHSRREGMDWDTRIRILGGLAGQIRKIRYNPGQMEMLAKQFNRRLVANGMKDFHDLFEHLFSPEKLSEAEISRLQQSIEATAGISSLFAGKTAPLSFERYVDAMRHQYVADQIALLIHHQIALREERERHGEIDPHGDLTNVDYCQRIEDLWQGKAKFTDEEVKLLQQFHEASQKTFSIEELKPGVLLSKAGLSLPHSPAIKGGENE
ncbi:MAG: hypothetical protein CTY19_12295 [Methylomonas sp.]|nr:MAG: hypothetical protein CTY19_12295 [Methylomonas sp.]